MDNSSDQEHTFSEVRCTYCVEKIRITDFCQLKRGDHICLPGSHAFKNKNLHLKHVYTHHAIVEQVNLINDNPSKAVIRCIHYFSHPFSSKLRIRETNTCLDLFRDEVYVQRYLYPGNENDPELIIKRGQEKIKQKKSAYNILTNNCEHFANDCALGEKESTQVGKVADTGRSAFTMSLSVSNVIGNLVGRTPLLKAIMKLAAKAGAMAADDSTALSEVNCALHSCLIPVYVLGGVLLVYFTYCVFRTYRLIRKYRKHKTICKKCFYSKLKDIWMKFVIFLLSQAVGLAIMVCVVIPFLSTPVGACIAVALSFTSVGLLVIIPKLYKKLQSPFQNTYKQAKGSAVKRGHIVQLKKLHHDSIVCGVQNNTDGTLTVSVIHYKDNGVFRTRKVVKEEYIVQHDDEVDIVDDSVFNCFTPDETCERASSRIDEERYAYFSNRNCHLSLWAKVRKTLPIQEPRSVTMTYKTEFDENRDKIGPSIIKNNTIGRPYSTMNLSSETVWIGADIRAGDVIRLKKQLGIVLLLTKINDTKTYKLEVATVDSTGKAAKNVWTIDFNRQNVEIRHYHPSHTFTKVQIVERAQMMIGIKQKNKEHFIMDVVRKDMEERPIKQFGDFEKGQVITYSQNRPRRHEVLVIEKDESENRLKVVHYSKGEVCEGDINVDFKEKQYFERTFVGYETYPIMISVERAKSRLGEKKYCVVGRRSKHFCHWVRVIQSPCIFDVSYKGSRLLTKADYGENLKEDYEALLIPDLGTATTDGYQMVEIFTLQELRAGSVIKFKWPSEIIPVKRTGYGIVSDVSTTENKFKVIYLKTDFLSVGKVVEEWQFIDIKKERIWLYRWHPGVCFPPTERIQNAQKQLHRKTGVFVFASLRFWFDQIGNNRDNLPTIPCINKAIT